MPERLPLADELVDLPVHSSERVFAGKVWDVTRDVFEFAGGTVTREYVDHTGAVAVLAMDDDDHVCLIRQYRHPIRAREWELPAGLLDEHGESPLAAAKRELAEEVDLEASDWSVLSDFHTSPGGSNEALRIYLARGLSATASVFARTEEESELEQHWVPLDDVVEAVLARDVQNAILIVGVLAAAASRSRGWETLADAGTSWPRHPLSR